MAEAPITIIPFYSGAAWRYPEGQRFRHCFSNFSKHTITVDKKVYPTSEHYYQAMKAKGTLLEERIRLAKTATIAKKIATSSEVVLPVDWETIKEDIMLVVLRAKFTQNEECKTALLGTKNALLEERSPTDMYWGTGSSRKGGKGKNRLGILLMQIREELSTSS